jgi:hypothetical protein
MEAGCSSRFLGPAWASQRYPYLPPFDFQLSTVNLCPPLFIYFLPPGFSPATE